MLVYVLDKDGNPLMPTHRLGRVRHWLKDGEAIVVSHQPFTIQFTKTTERHTQDLNLGIDAGYKHIGVSVLNTSKNEEIYSESVDQRANEVKKNIDRRMYRKTRRNKLRHRKPRFDNRKPFKKSEGFAPSIYHKFQEHLKAIVRVKKLLPVSNIHIEVTPFDNQMIKAKFNNEAVKRQNGDMQGHSDIKSYIFERDNYTCAVCNIKKQVSQLHCHHVKFKSKGGTNQPDNLLTVCTNCHTPKNHQKGHVLYQMMQAKQNPFYQGAFFMSALKILLEKHLTFEQAFGYETSAKRISFGWDKDHHIDALVIAGANKDTKPYSVHINRTKLQRNNRSLSKFYDAKWLDSRDHNVKSGKELSNGRINRNHTNNSENEHVYRCQKIKAGRISTRKQHYQIRPHDILNIGIVKGVQNLGKYIKLNSGKVVSTKTVRVLRHVNGYLVETN